MALVSATRLLLRINASQTQVLSLPFLSQIHHCGFSAPNSDHCFIWIETNGQGGVLVVVPRFLVYFFLQLEDFGFVHCALRKSRGLCELTCATNCWGRVPKFTLPLTPHSHSCQKLTAKFPNLPVLPLLRVWRIPVFPLSCSIHRTVNFPDYVWAGILTMWKHYSMGSWAIFQNAYLSLILQGEVAGGFKYLSRWEKRKQPDLWSWSRGRKQCWLQRKHLQGRLSGCGWEAAQDVGLLPSTFLLFLLLLFLLILLLPVIMYLSVSFLKFPHPLPQ